MTKKKTKLPRSFYAEIGKKGGRSNAKSPKAVRPFRDVPGLASKAGSVSGYKLKKRRRSDAAA